MDGLRRTIGKLGCGYRGWKLLPPPTCSSTGRRDSRRGAYKSGEELLDREQLDFVDIATHAASHFPLVRYAAGKKIPIICQKPIAPDWAGAVELVNAAETAGVRLMIHENWRWQPWYRVANQMIANGDIGAPIGYGFRFRRSDGLGEEPYTEQAYFRKEPRLIIQVTLVHHMDTARFLFGEIDSVYAETSRRNPRIVAEDQAIIVLTHEEWGSWLGRRPSVPGSRSGWPRHGRRIFRRRTRRHLDSCHRRCLSKQCQGVEERGHGRPPWGQRTGDAGPLHYLLERWLSVRIRRPFVPAHVCRCSGCVPERSGGALCFAY